MRLSTRRGPTSMSAPCNFLAGDLPKGTDPDTATSLRRSCSTGGELERSPSSSITLHYTLCSRCPANLEQRGQGELERYEVTCTRTSSGVSLTEVISKPSGKGNNGDESISVLCGQRARCGKMGGEEEWR